MSELREKIEAILEAGDMMLNPPEDLAEFIDKEAIKESRIDQIQSLLKVKMRGLTDEELNNVEIPCLKNEPCPFGVADRTATDQDWECDLCEKQCIGDAQLDQIKADNLDVEFEERLRGLDK